MKLYETKMEIVIAVEGITKSEAKRHTQGIIEQIRKQLPTGARNTKIDDTKQI